MSDAPSRQIVDALETAGEPLSRAALAERTDLDGGELDTALSRLRGRQVLRYLSGEEVYRLTYWPEQTDCVACGGGITGQEYYELELNAEGTTTESTMTGSLHADCAVELIDDLSLESADPEHQ